MCFIEAKIVVSCLVILLVFFLILLRCRMASKNKVEVRRKQWADEDMVSA